MEKFLRLLNPKTINYEADRIDGGVQQLTAQDVLLAMSYAKLSQLQDNLIRLKYFGANTNQNVEKFSKILISKYRQRFLDADLDIDYQYAVVLVALTEFCLVPANYTSTERNRGIICGWSRTVVRNHLNQHIAFVLVDLKEQLAEGEDKIIFQIYKIK